MTVEAAATRHPQTFQTPTMLGIMRPVANNSYYALRHGTSVANEQALIVSHPDLGVENYGLNSAGKAQLGQAAAEYWEVMGEVAAIYSSDFLRTRETATIVAGIRGQHVELTPLLRERFFGDWDRTSSSNYRRVWREDRRDARHRRWNVESVVDVAERLSVLIAECEEKYNDATILLVSHGDPLQILECLFRGHSLGSHRELRTLEPGELRRL